MLIRPEQATDATAIEAVTRAAFADHPHSDQCEHFIITALRAAGALPISLVAELKGEIVGHVAFSPVNISDGSQHWYGLGPVSVLPEFQNRGIGRALIENGLALLRANKAQGCVVAGDPAYYQRFGFRHIETLSYPGLPAEYFMALPFHTELPQGSVNYHAAFSAQA
ncbi:acetyltransferase [Janthinobacterium sp. Marseille]|nr:N-acetyltransferase [Janthinobacterium sp. Marseille]ABR88553.1 acetyltransferase [Janthinobacterium sp. Marseille]